MNQKTTSDERYTRHLALPDFGWQEQQRLQNSSVLVVGAGGLGSPLLLYLAAAGVGRIGIIDGDTVDKSNLQRQILYSTSDTGQYKAQLAGQRLKALNPEISVQVHAHFLQPENALDIIAQYDYVADGSDNFATRYLVNDASVILGKPNVYASVFRYEGQVSVFNCSRTDGSRGPNYRDLYPIPPSSGQVPNCAEAGVLGSLTGIIGSIQANELIKLITGIGQVLDARMLLLDSRSMQTHILQLPGNSRFPIHQLADNYHYPDCERSIPEITFSQLLEWQQHNKSFELLDVRTPRERQHQHLGGIHIPLDQLPSKLQQLNPQKTWIVYCHSGIRSATATQWLLEHGYTQVYNLKGGIVQAMRHKRTPS